MLCVAAYVRSTLHRCLPERTWQRYLGVLHLLRAALQTSMHCPVYAVCATVRAQGTCRIIQRASYTIFPAELSEG